MNGGADEAGCITPLTLQLPCTHCVECVAEQQVGGWDERQDERQLVVAEEEVHPPETNAGERGGGQEVGSEGGGEKKVKGEEKRM